MQETSMNRKSEHRITNNPSAHADAGLSSSRRQMLMAAGAAAALSAAPAVRAQGAAFPSRPVTLMVPFPPGAATDAIARALAVPLAKHLGQQVIVENRAGASGTLTTQAMAQSTATDGYAVAIAPATIFRVPHLQKVPYDPLKDITYIMKFSGYTFSLVVTPDSPYKTFAEFVTFAKANPGKVIVGASGSGSTGHIATFTLAKAIGAEITFVPFKGGAEVLAAFKGGHINAVIDGGWAQIEKAGGGRVLATFGEKRIGRLPDIPTARDAGFDIVSRSPIGLVGPRNMDARAVKAWHDALKGSMTDPDYLRLIALHDLENDYLSGEDFRKLGERLWVDEKKNFEAIGMKTI
jgi:tripartite-type tricarboxylate transporter receptor subunit TctC